jgi:AcrR family transcriptional regulator
VTSPHTGRATAPAPTTTRGRPRDTAADQRILAATFRQLVDVGYGGLAIEAVAAEAGVAKTTIYRRYPTKRDLVIASLGREVPFPPATPDLTARDALELFVRTGVHMLIETGAVRVLASLLIEDQREPGILDTFRSRLLEPRRDLVIAMLRRGMERGELRADIDPLIVTEMVAGAIFGHHAVLGQPTTEAWIEDLVDHVWHAIAMPRTQVDRAT